MNKQLIGGIAIGLAVFLLVRPRRPAPPPPPPPPQQGGTTSAWERWVNTILQTYGHAKWLWEPGGPFYKGADNAVVHDLLPDYSDYA